MTVTKLYKKGVFAIFAPSKIARRRHLVLIYKTPGFISFVLLTVLHYYLTHPFSHLLLWKGQGEVKTWRGLDPPADRQGKVKTEKGLDKEKFK